MRGMAVFIKCVIIVQVRQLKDVLASHASVGEREDVLPTFDSGILPPRAEWEVGAYTA